ncbi:MAG TPA: DoxX family protein [Chryseolinea sp.]|nr:DoxX family protein [Chryseolinea sp.]
MTTKTTQAARPRALHITLWIAQAIVASMFLMAGFMKTFTPIEDLSVIMPWAKDSQVLIRFIGISELLGGLGLIFPAALRIAPRLTVLAAWGLALIMVLALLFHFNRGEMSALPTNIVLGLLSVFIAWGRSTKVPIHQRA